MKTTAIVLTVHKQKHPEMGQARRRTSLRTRLVRLNGWTVVWYVFLTVAGILLFKVGAAYALRQRGYHTVGGEALALFLPVLYYPAAVTIWDIIPRRFKGRRR